jgi:hypothetical protein
MANGMNQFTWEHFVNTLAVGRTGSFSTARLWLVWVADSMGILDFRAINRLEHWMWSWGGGDNLWLFAAMEANGWHDLIKEGVCIMAKVGSRSLIRLTAAV